jgi:hypothetical protein
MNSQVCPAVTSARGLELADLERLAPFIAREDLLNTLALRLEASNQHNRVALFGLSGIG